MRKLCLLTKEEKMGYILSVAGEVLAVTDLRKGHCLAKAGLGQLAGVTVG